MDWMERVTSAHQTKTREQKNFAFGENIGSLILHRCAYYYTIISQNRA